VLILSGHEKLIEDGRDMPFYDLSEEQTPLLVLYVELVQLVMLRDTLGSSTVQLDSLYPFPNGRRSLHPNEGIHAMIKALRGL
jgi:hypothetical protein